MSLQKKYFLQVALLVCALYCVNLTSGQEEDVVVEAGILGKIRGVKVQTAYHRREYIAFHGIPFATPESYTGSRRFQPSSFWNKQLPNDENGEFVAKNILTHCVQRDLFNLNVTNAQDLAFIYGAMQKSRKEVRKVLKETRGMSLEERKRRMPRFMGTEDCLVLNVNTPKIPRSDDEPRLPVVVFIHGGGSERIWGSAFTGLRVLDKDLVLVSINYRLGVLGALNLGINDAPGNAGLYDALESLKWIREHIWHFGGDPNRVTITGQSAGAAMVTHLLLSPLAVDNEAPLFHGVWGYSGAALNVWATSKEPSLPHHLIIAQKAGCITDPNNPGLTPAQMVECMRSKSLQDLVDALEFYKDDEEIAGRLGYDARVASIQSSNSITIPKIMPEKPLTVLERGGSLPVPLILGATRHDGSYPLDDIYENFLVANDLVNNSTFIRNDLLPFLINMLGFPDDSGALYHAFAYSYLGEAANSDRFDPKIPGLLDMSTVFGFKAGEYKMLEHHHLVEPRSYFYSFDYKGLWSIYYVMWGTDAKIPGGICHTDDLLYVFYIFPLVTSDDLLMADKMVNYLGNFTYYGNPNGENVQPEDEKFPRYDSLKHHYLKINKRDRVVENCMDTWMGASLELIDPEDDTTTTEPPTTESPTESPTTEEEGGDSTTTTTGTPTTPSMSSNVQAAAFTVVLISALSILF